MHIIQDGIDLNKIYLNLNYYSGRWNVRNSPPASYLLFDFIIIWFSTCKQMQFRFQKASTIHFKWLLILTFLLCNQENEAFETNRCEFIETTKHFEVNKFVIILFGIFYDMLISYVDMIYSGYNFIQLRIFRDDIIQDPFPTKTKNNVHKCFI